MSTTNEHAVPRNVPYFPLKVRTAFDALTDKEKLYAHHMAWAGWYGFSACSKQLSWESPQLLRAFHELFSTNTVAGLKTASVGEGEGKVNEEEFQDFINYVAYTYSNCGNYLSFGDSKIIPASSRASFEKIIASAPTPVAAWPSALMDKVFSLTSEEKTLSYDCSAYYGPNISQEEIAVIDKWMVEQRMEAVNTRIFKTADGVLNLKLASANPIEKKEYTSGGTTFIVDGEDFKPEMTKVVEALTEARKYTANDTQTKMLDAYIKHFQDGDVKDHKDSQKYWVQDKGPAVETNIGFIENYRDPAGVRAEWEGLVAVVNKEESAKYEEMVQKAPQFIAELPWGENFEQETFKKPDFTALEVLGFASSGIPIGICIPNYDDIRKEFGFKNVYLSNVVAAMSFKEKINHITDEDWKLWPEKISAAFSVGVGIHELLGHGTGKLLSENEKGELNFDKEKVINPIDGKPISSWYKPGETWSSVFKALSNPYEECRAEAVALYLCLDPAMLAIFGQTTEEDCFKVIHVVWLQMVRAGLVGLEFYSPEKSQWLQAHMRARYCILQTLLRGENPLVTIHRPEDPEKGELNITIDAKRIATDGKKAIGNLLVHLNVFKSTADQKRGSEFFEELTAVDDKMLELRKIVMSKKKPRRQVVQPHTTLTAEGKVELIDFDGSVEGVIDSLVRRHNEIPLAQ